MSSRSGLGPFFNLTLLMGLSPIHPYLRKNSDLYNSSLFIPILIQLSFTSIEIYIAIKFPEEIYHPTSVLGAATDYVQVFGIISISVAFIVENLLMGQLDTKIRKTIERIDRDIYSWHFCYIGTNCPKCRKLCLKRFLYKKAFWLVIVSSLTDFWVILTIPEEERAWRQSIILRKLSKDMVYISLLRIICYFGWITNRLEFVQRELKRSFEAAVTVLDENELHPILNEIVELHRLYCRLWSIKQDLKHRFEKSIFVMICVFFCSFIIGMYWMLLRIHFRRRILRTIFLFDSIVEFSK